MTTFADLAQTLVPALDAPPVLEARKVCFAYRRQQSLLVDVDVVLAPGRVTALTGASGRGKSTLLYILAGLLRPASGRVVVEGQDLYALSPSQQACLRATRFGFVFQDAVLDPNRTVLDAIVEPCLYTGGDLEVAEHRAIALMAMLGVHVDPSSRPGEVSGGQAQRIGVCRALLSDPRVIFADEPTAALDNMAAAAVMEAMVTAAGRGAAVAVATHDDRALAYCTDRVVL